MYGSRSSTTEARASSEAKSFLSITAILSGRDPPHSLSAYRRRARKAVSALTFQRRALGTMGYKPRVWKLWETETGRNKLSDTRSFPTQIIAPRGRPARRRRPRPRPRDRAAHLQRRAPAFGDRGPERRRPRLEPRGLPHPDPRAQQDRSGRRGAFIPVPRLERGPCAVAAVEAWLAILGEKKGPVGVGGAIRRASDDTCGGNC